MTPKFSVILPARNEAANLGKLISSLISKYKGLINEIIIVEDCSTDKTLEIALLLQTRYPKYIKIIKRKSPPGVGLALRDGMKNISHKSHYVLFMDSDFLINIPDIAKMIAKIPQYDGVVGSRFMSANSLLNYPKLKFIANRSYHFLTRLFLGIKHTDLTNNFKLYQTELVHKIYPFLTSSDFSVNSEIGYYPVLLGAKIGEVPVKWQERSKQMGVSKFKLFLVGPSYLNVFLKLILMKIKLL